MSDSKKWVIVLTIRLRKPWIFVFNHWLKTGYSHVMKTERALAPSHVNGPISYMYDLCDRHCTYHNVKKSYAGWAQSARCHKINRASI